MIQLTVILHKGAEAGPEVDTFEREKQETVVDLRRSEPNRTKDSERVKEIAGVDTTKP